MGIAPVKHIVTPAYNVSEPGPRLTPPYVEALVRLPVFAQKVTRSSKGVWSSLRLYAEGFFGVDLPAPPQAEQRAFPEQIARATAKVGGVRAGTERTIIALLEERRSALFNAAAGQLDAGAAG